MSPRYTPSWLLFLTIFCLSGLTKIFAVEIGMERIYVIHELGRPTYSVAKSGTEVLTYPGGVRITLKNGRVSELTGIKPTEGAIRSPETPANVPASEPKPVMSEVQTDELAKMEHAQNDADAKAR